MIAGLFASMGVVKGKNHDTRDMDPHCVNASNQFHKCADYCSQNMPNSLKGSP